jgi:hypothetical protein
VILIISNQELDGHVPPVVAELERRGEEFFIYDPATYPTKSAVTFQSSLNGVRASLSIDGTRIDLSHITSVWYRRPGQFRFLEGLSPEEEKWVRDECSHLFRGVWGEGVIPRWVSDPEAIRKASVKITQLKIAMELGFVVPRFVITNEVACASEFLASCSAGAIVKVLAAPGISYSQRAGTIYTHLITNADLDEIASVQFGPTFLQEFIHKTMDIRVTIIGKSLHAVGIDSQGMKEARVDFRRAKIYTLPHTLVTLPPQVSALCFELVHRLGLEFGAIDLLVTPEGHYIFLEINPNGQWYWLEEVTGIPLTKAMCDLLTERS